jgi:hypothetical protein
MSDFGVARKLDFVVALVIVANNFLLTPLWSNFPKKKPKNEGIFLSVFQIPYRKKKVYFLRKIEKTILRFAENKKG